MERHHFTAEKNAPLMSSRRITMSVALCRSLAIGGWAGRRNVVKVVGDPGIEPGVRLREGTAGGPCH